MDETLLMNTDRDSGERALSVEALAEVAVDVTRILRGHHIVGIWSNQVAQNALRNALDDYFLDELSEQRGLQLPLELIDRIQDRLLSVGRARFG